MSVVNATPLLAAAGGDYQISRSVRLRSSASAYFNRTPAGAGNRKTWTWSGWVKRGSIGGSSIQSIFSAGSSGSFPLVALFWFNDFIDFYADAAGTGTRIRTSAVYRDPSAWYHIVISCDTTQATSSERLKLCVNGVQVTALSTNSPPAQNTDLSVNNTVSHYHGAYAYDTSTNRLDGYLTEINFIDGQALTPSSFGETDTITGVWKPKKYAGTYGTNGFYLNFSDNSSNTATTIGKDYSGNGNNWTPNNISVTAGVTYDSMIDVPTLYADGGNGRGNYAVLNSAIRPYPGTDAISNGNLTLSCASASVSGSAWATVPVVSGKWYFEGVMTGDPGGVYRATFGVGSNSSYYGSGTYAGAFGDGGGYAYNSDGQKVLNGATFTSYGASWTNNDVIGVALDADAGTVTFYKNGVSQGTAFTGISYSGSGYVFGGKGINGMVLSFNFGQRPFSYTPPTGFKALNTQNLPEPVIKKGNQYFDVSLFTGTDASQNVTGINFQPDLVWRKARSAAESNILVDAVRGAGLGLLSNSTNAEASVNSTTAFLSNGFTGIGSNGVTYVGWQWKESATSGFDIVTYTGNGGTQDIAHGLGVTPKMMIVKSRGSAQNWPVYHASLGKDKIIYLSLTLAPDTTANFWGSSGPSSSAFTVTSNNLVNTTGIGYVAYLFSEVAGFSKFGSYTGNGSTDGPFVWCGFRPRWVLIKRADSTGTWTIHDSARNTYNPENLTLRPESSGTENTSGEIEDFTSNGFKVRSADLAINASGGTYIFAAFAEHPFKNSLAR